MEELFYYNRRKCFANGAFHLLIIAIIRPFYRLVYGGPEGIIIFLFFIRPLMHGLNYMLKSLIARPAVKLTSDFLEVDTFYRGRQQIDWAEIKTIRSARRKGSPRIKSGSTYVQHRFSMDVHFVVLTPHEGKEIEIRLDALQLEGRHLEQLLREYKGMHYFQPNQI